jgi:hypothetical protein
MKLYLPTRRQTIIGGFVSLLGTISPAHARRKAVKMSNESNQKPTYDSHGISLNPLAQYWPDKHPQPKLIVDIAHLIAPWPWPVMGPFYITGARFNDYIVENGADLYEDFGIFMRFANGSEYAIWYHEGCVPGAEPVVCIDDEGQHRNLAPTLHAFFTAWAEGKGMDMLEPFDYDVTVDVQAERQAKGKEIQALLAKVPKPDTPAPAPDFYDYMQKYGEASRAANASNPTLQAISKLLDVHIPRGRKEWEAEVYTLTAKGDDVLVERRQSDALFPERKALVPLLKQARSERAQGKTAQLGLWKSAVMRLYPNGLVQIGASWDDS